LEAGMLKDGKDHPPFWRR